MGEKNKRLLLQSSIIKRIGKVQSSWVVDIQRDAKKIHLLNFQKLRNKPFHGLAS